MGVAEENTLWKILTVPQPIRLNASPKANSVDFLFIAYTSNSKIEKSGFNYSLSYRLG